MLWAYVSCSFFLFEVFIGPTGKVHPSQMVQQFVLPDLSGLGSARAEVPGKLALVAVLPHGLHDV